MADGDVRLLARIGTAGWSVAALAATIEPAGTHLRRYGTLLNAVEINSSFYRPHRTATYARWAASVPEHFAFAVKVPRAMTHERRLADCREAIGRFAGEVAGLGDRLGPLLVQLPPSLAFAPAVAAPFFAALRGAIAAPIVCEPRHRSWFTTEADTFLGARAIARVAADPPPVPGAERPGGWGGLIYMRLHGSPRIYRSAYDEGALAAVAEQLARHAARGAPAWCVFDNTQDGHAIGNALALAARSGR